MDADRGRQPAIYLPHGGGPWPWMADPPGRWDGLRAYLRDLPGLLPGPPRAIALVTAHWEEPEFTVASGARPELIYDYHGFPEDTYRVTYPAPGAPDVAEQVVALAADAGVTVRADPTHGWDHGVFVPLAVAWPEADVPVVALSLRTGLDPAEHLAFGEALAALRDDDVVVLGSGLNIHDLRFRIQPAQAEAFDDWLAAAMGAAPDRRRRELARWTEAPHARAAHPREEHLLPAMVIAGAGGDDRATRTPAGELFGLPMSAYTFGR